MEDFGADRGIGGVPSILSICLAVSTILFKQCVQGCEYNFMCVNEQL